VRRACREYALAREEACDAAALQATGAAPREYGRLLLVFGVARAPAAAAAPGASSHLAALKRRIAMLEHVETEPQPRTRQLRWLLGGLALAALVPFQVVARAPEAPTPPPAPLSAEAPATASSLPPLLAQAAIPPAPPAPPPPLPAAPSEDVDEAYVLVRPNDSSVAMSGSTRDLRRARSLAQGAKEPVLYLRRDEQEYLIRNPDTLKAFEAALKPLEQLGAKQGELGAQQGELGAKQGELGAKMGELGAKQGELGQRHAELALAQIQQQRAGKESPEIERQQQELDRAQEELSRQMDALGEQMDVIGRQMDAVGEQMEAEGEKMEAQSREAEKKINTLLDDAVRKGVAEPVKR